VPATPNSSTRRAHSSLRLWMQALTLLLVAGLLARLVYNIVQRPAPTRVARAIAAGKKPAAPDFRLGIIWPHGETWPRSLQDAIRRGSVSAPSLRGYPAVINFWASWCGPCGREAPLLGAAARARRGTVVFLGIDVHDFKSDARRFLARYGVPYVAVHAGGDGLLSAYGLVGLPDTFFLDEHGRIVAARHGQVSKRQLEAGIARATSH
jgi:cytochrome c biogenesis protein CcmG, thiol:disulfide interchange protein DsbE